MNIEIDGQNADDHHLSKNSSSEHLVQALAGVADHEVVNVNDIIMNRSISPKQQTGTFMNQILASASKQAF